MLYDNGNFRPVEYSRPVSYQLHLDSFELEQTFEWIDPDYEPVLFSPFVGDADVLENGNILVTDGCVAFTVPPYHFWVRIVEITQPSNDKVWELKIGDYDDPVSWAGYRADRIAGLYPIGRLFADGFESGDTSSWTAAGN